MRRYPVKGPRPFIACPRHGLAVSVDESGHIVSTCPSCVREAERGYRNLLRLRGQSEPKAAAWSTSA